MRILGFALLLCAVTAALVSPARAAMINVDTEIDAKITSAYFWRGQIINDEACFQPDVYVRGSNITASLWGTWNLTDTEGASASTRMDGTLEYKFTVADINIIRPGLIAYVYHDDSFGKAKDTFETYLGYTVDTTLLPSVVVYYDFNQVKGFYGLFQVAHSFDLGRECGLDQDVLALDIKASVGGADSKYMKAKFTVPADEARQTAEYVPAKASLVDATATVALPISAGNRVTITPAAAYMTLLDGDTRTALKNAGRDTSIFVYSLSIGVAF